MAMTLDFPDLAEEMMEQRLREWPCSVEYLLLLALALYAQGKDQEREKSVLRRAEMLDEDDYMARALLEMPWHDGPQDPRQMMKQSIRFMENMAGRRYPKNPWQCGRRIDDASLYGADPLL